MADLQTYSGIVNENEFFSHHYFSSEFQNNIKDLLDEWNSRETEEEGFKSPVNLLKNCRKEWFINLNQAEKTKDQTTLFKLFRERHLPLLKSLGWEIQPTELEIQPGAPLPIWKAMQNSREEWTALVMPVYRPGLEDDPFEQQLEKVHYQVSEVPSEIKGKPWASIISDIIFGADFPPRFLILVADQEWILVDRFKWPNNRVLRFQWNEILDRRDNATHQASASSSTRINFLLKVENLCWNPSMRAPTNTLTASVKTSNMQSGKQLRSLATKR